MKIMMLGNGGAINDGLPYNAFLVDGRTLVEAPPDIMLSLHREGVRVNDIREIYISHLHGDHCFGFPFLALDLFYRSVTAGLSGGLTVFSVGGEGPLRSLAETALGAGHPCIAWMRRNMAFIDLSGRGEISLAGERAFTRRMDHMVETYGFIMDGMGDPPLAYSADTRWCDGLASMITAGPRAIIIDLNGEPSDPAKIHLSEEELLARGIPLAKERTTFYGTHLKSQKESPNARIIYARPGMKLDLN